MEEVHLNINNGADSPLSWSVVDVFVHTAREHDEPHIHLRTDEWELSVDIDLKGNNALRILLYSDSLNPDLMSAAVSKWFDMPSKPFPGWSNREAAIIVYNMVNEND